MQFQGHGGANDSAMVSTCAAIFCDKPGEHLVKNGVGIFHLDLFVQLFEGNCDEVEESIDEVGVHFFDIVVLLECYDLGEFDVGMIIGVVASTVIWHISNFRGKWIV
jgi:hypothetical protein